MFGYLVHRLLIMIPTLIAISLIVVVIIQLPPGDYLTTYVAELQSQGEEVNQDKIAFLREQYGFGKPWWEQYTVWAVGMLHGDFGFSFEYNTNNTASANRGGNSTPSGRSACCTAISASRSSTTCRSPR
jgi:peptide/nickel transport system permease protein